MNPQVSVPPYIKRVQVRDHAPLRDATVSFKRGLNIIIGSNGAGKTRFLTLVSELADLHEKKAHYLGAGCRVVFGGIFGEQDEVEVTFEEQDESVIYEPVGWHILLSNSIVLQTTDNYRDYLHEGQIVEDFLAHYTPVLISHGIPATGLPILDESAEIMLEKRAVTVQLKTGPRRIDELSSQFVRALMRTIVGLVRNGFTVLNGVPVPPMSAEAVRHQVARLVAVYTTRLSEALALYSPVRAVRCSEFFQVYYQDSQDQYNIKGLALEYQLGEDWLSFGMLSDGTKRLVYTLAEMMAPEAVGLNKIADEIVVQDRRKTFLLEEPELGIHPSQLHKLLSLIREVSREHQVIMTTHSPQVLDMLSEKELDRITICELDPQKGTQFHKLSAAKKKQARAYMREELHLSDFWRYSYLENEA